MSRAESTSLLCLFNLPSRSLSCGDGHSVGLLLSTLSLNQLIATAVCSIAVSTERKTGMQLPLPDPDLIPLDR